VLREQYQALRTCARMSLSALQRDRRLFTHAQVTGE